MRKIKPVSKPIVHAPPDKTRHIRIVNLEPQDKKSNQDILNSYSFGPR